MDPEKLQALFDSHYSLIEQKMDMFTDQMNSVNAKVDKICNNELQHIKDQLTEQGTNLSWLMKTYWIVMGASIGALITALITLIEK
jgi:hypothetical protein